MLGVELVSLFLHAITLPTKATPQFPDLGLILTLPLTGMWETPRSPWASGFTSVRWEAGFWKPLERKHVSVQGRVWFK